MKLRRLSAAVLTTILLLAGVVFVPAASAAVEEVSAQGPQGTTQVWVDIEAPDLLPSHVTVTTGAGSTLPLTATVFGASAVAAVSPGAFTLNVKAESALDVDVVLTFADAQGRVLKSQRQRLSISPEETVEPVQLKVERLAGSDRYSTNLAVNRGVAKSGKPAFIATGEDFPDALAIGPAVAVTGGSLFLTSRKGLALDALQLLVKNNPSHIYIVGGTGAVPEAVAKSVRAETRKTPVRLGGSTRYETSALIFETFFSDRPFDVAFVATGRNYPDALSAAAAGGALEAPVLLVDGTKGTGLDAKSAKLLAAKSPRKVAVAGGDGAVNRTIASSLSKNYVVERLAGSTRYGTNLAVNNFVTKESGGTPLTQVWIATGKNFPDALSAAAPAGAKDKRLVLSDGSCIPQPVVTGWIKAPGSRVTQVNLVGSTGVLSPSIESLSQCSEQTK